MLKNISWSSTDTTLDPGMKKSDYDQDSVLNRFDIQLKKTGLNTKHTLSPDFSWAAEDINEIINKYTGKKLNLLFTSTIYLVLRALSKLSVIDKGSSELLCLGYFIICKKK